jgi:hypothetical protein
MMGRAMQAHSSATAAFFDVDWIHGKAVEVFYADDVLADGFGSSTGWYWWACYPGCLPDGDAFGPFPTSDCAYHDATTNFAALGDAAAPATRRSTAAPCLGCAVM